MSIATWVGYRGEGGSPFIPLAQNYRVLELGDSTVAGFGAGDGTGTDPGATNARPNAVSTRLAVALNGVGIAANDHSRFGRQGFTTSALLFEYDPRASGTFNTGGAATLGGLSIVATSSLPEVAATFAGVDTFDFYNYRTLAAGTLDILIDDVVVGTINQFTGVDDLVLNSFATTLGTRTIKIRRTAGTARWTGVNAYNSAVNSVQVINAGVRGATVLDIIGSGTPTTPLGSIAVVNPHLSIISIGINDYRTTGGTTAPDKATFKARLQTLVDACLATQGGTGKVILRYPTPTSTTGGGGLTLAQCQESYDEIAAAESLPLLDTIAATGTYAVVNAAGEMFDTLHPKAIVYDRVAVALMPLVRTALGI